MLLKELMSILFWELDDELLDEPDPEEETLKDFYFYTFCKAYFGKGDDATLRGNETDC